MIDDFDSEATYTLNYQHNDGTIYTFTFEEKATWPAVLEQMTKFISTVYGYDISEQVAIKDNPYRLDRDDWSGPVFGKKD